MANNASGKTGVNMRTRKQLEARLISILDCGRLENLGIAATDWMLGEVPTGTSEDIIREVASIGTKLYPLAATHFERMRTQTLALAASDGTRDDNDSLCHLCTKLVIYNSSDRRTRNGKVHFHFRCEKDLRDAAKKLFATSNSHHHQTTTRFSSAHMST
ncbi:MAG TPA: hypothetical protein VEC17_00655 [Candidatus Binatia bacterium]|nr:hypothetical protein [Candidatus Binatia bacterium]